MKHIIFILLVLIGFNSYAIDLDQDGIEDLFDNCLEKANPNQIDKDGDGFGDLCDADYDNDGLVNGSDYLVFGTNWGSRGVFGYINDQDNDGAIFGTDFMLFGEGWSKGVPGPTSWIKYLYFPPGGCYEGVADPPETVNLIVEVGGEVFDPTGEGVVEGACYQIHYDEYGLDIRASCFGAVEPAQWVETVIEHTEGTEPGTPDTSICDVVYDQNGVGVE